MPGEVPVTPPLDAIEESQAPQTKIEILSALEPISRVNSRQRFAQRDTTYDNPDRDPGVVRFRTEAEGSYEPGIVREAITVDASRQYLTLTGEIKFLTDQRKPIGTDLKEQAKEGWRGTEFDDIEGVGRLLNTRPETTANVTDQDRFREGAGDDFPRVAKRRMTIAIDIEEGLHLRGGTMSPELIRSIIETALAKSRLNPELQSRLISWGEPETIFLDLDVLRELVEADRISLDSIRVNRTFDLVPDVLPKERSPRPKEHELTQEPQVIKTD